MVNDIREATVVDAQRLAELRFEFRAPRSPNTETRDEFVHRCTLWMERALSSDSWRCWAAMVEGQIVGQVWVHLIEKIPNPLAELENHAYITNLYVQENARGGMGNGLMDIALAWCWAQEIDTVILWPTELSRTLYQRKGFAVTPDVMSLREPREE